MFKMLRAGVRAAAGLCAAASTATTILVEGGDGARGDQIQAYQPIGQSFVATDTNLMSFGFDFQTFNTTTTGLAGGPMTPNDPVTLTIVNGAGLTGSVVATRTATLPLLPQDRELHPYDFDLTGTMLTVGQSYTALLSTTSTRLGVVFGPTIDIYTSVQQSGDAYTQGRLYAAGGVPVDCTTFDDCDLNFRFTSVSPAAAVPEPLSWVTCVAGFGAIGSALRRCKKDSMPITFAG